MDAISFRITSRTIDRIVTDWNSAITAENLRRPFDLNATNVEYAVNAMQGLQPEDLHVGHYAAHFVDPPLPNPPPSLESTLNGDREFLLPPHQIPRNQAINEKRNHEYVVRSI